MRERPRSAMISQEQQPAESRESSLRFDVLLSVGVASGLIILIAAQLFLLPLLTARRSIKTADSSQGGWGSTATADVTHVSSAMQLVSCADSDLGDAVALVKPAIVNIDVASSDVGPAARKGGPPPSFDMPPSGALEADEETLGSGIVVDARGYILTCYHLIRDYPKIYVTVFSSKRETYEADVVDVDPANDFAILRIWPDSPLLTATLANSGLVKVTDLVLAIGSPFGFEHTVTKGIISDDDRSILVGGTVYDELFQTDVAVNRGSAGGALINTDGEVIAVNTAIASGSDFFSGISFAIPINRARPLLLKAIED